MQANLRLAVPACLCFVLAACERDASMINAPGGAEYRDAAAADADAVLFLRFDGNLNDESTYQHSVSFHGSLEFRRGCDDDAVMFDGGEYASVAFSPVFEPAQVTVEVWMSPKRVLADNSGFHPLVVKYAGNFWNTVDGYDLWYQDSGVGGRVGFGIGTQDGSVRKHASLTTDLLPSHVYHIVGTFDGSFARLYVNGDLVAQTAHAEALAYLGGGIRIGGGVYHSYYGGTQYYRGIVDQVAIFPRAMSAAEIAERSQTCDRVVLVEGQGGRGRDTDITTLP